jgi:hypothetical protein
MRRWLDAIAKKPGQRAGAPLREFVYLDQVSVYSLIASRRGAVTTQVTENESSSVGEQLNTTAGASVGVAHSEVAAHSQSSHSIGSQVLRKSVIQSTFKDLVEIESGSMALRAPAPQAKAPRVRSADDLQDILLSRSIEDWVIDPQELRRGQLFEVEVTLEADAIFRVGMIMSTVLGIVKENPALVGLSDPGELEKVLTAERLLQALLVGLVPLRASVLNYRHVSAAGRELLVHRALLEDLPASPDLMIRPLQVVGVAEEGLFWRDIRRVLFSHARYRVLGRLGRDGVQQTWSPVKLADILTEVAPNMAKEMSDAGPTFLAAMKRASTGGESDDVLVAERMRGALIAYAGALAAHHGRIYTAQQLMADGLPSAEQCDSYAGVEAQRAAFAAITEHLEQKLQIPSDPLLAAQLREQTLGDAGIELTGAVSPGAAQADLPVGQSTDATPASRYLDAEIVAIYW